MEEQRIYTTDSNNFANGALMGACLNRNNDNSAEMTALMNGGMNNWANNPFIYLVWMMFANRMWGNNKDGI